VHSAGDLGWDLVANPQFEVPAGSGKHALFASSFWIGALDASDQLRVSTQTYRQGSLDLFPGPIANRYDRAYDTRYDRVYKVTAAEVTTHRAMWNQAGYQAPADLLDWPAHGDTLNGEPWMLAPFVDNNNDGKYEPQDGDYPLFYGDQVLYSVFNDLRMPRGATWQGQPLGIDIHSMAYVYAAPTGHPHDQTMFLTYKVVNRSSQTLHNMQVAQWTDFDLGYFLDDVLAADTVRNAYFSYNADDMDGTNGAIHYLDRPPALAIQFYNQRMSSFSLSYNTNDSTIGNPTSASQFNNYIRGRWADGSPITVGGNGYGGQTPTSYIFSGDPLDTSQWSMISTPGILNGDYRGTGSTGPYTLAPGESVCIETGFVFAQTDTGNHLHSVQLLQQRLDFLQSIYDSTQHGCHAFETSGHRLSTSISNPQASTLPIHIGPNPTSDYAFVELSQRGDFELSVFDTQGKKVFEYTGVYTAPLKVDVSDWVPGNYMFTIRSEGSIRTKKLVKYE
jgi:hypothetical protein